MDIYTQSNKAKIQQGVKATLYAMKMYTGELENLQKRGISNDFLQYLTSQGQSGLQYVHAMAASMSDEELRIFQQQWDEFQGYISGTNDNVEHLMESYTETIMGGIDGGYDTWYEYGIKTVQGLFDAISDAQALIDAGSFTGTLGDALINVLQGRQSDIASSVQQTQSNVAQIDRKSVV